MRAGAFSLIELLIVITIIGVIAAIAVPAYQRYQSTAKLQKMMTYANGLVDRVKIYNGIHGYFPWPSQLGLVTQCGGNDCQLFSPEDNGELNTGVSVIALAGSTTYRNDGFWYGPSSNNCYAIFIINDATGAIKFGEKYIQSLDYIVYENNGIVNTLCQYDAWDPINGTYDGDLGINGCTNYASTESGDARTAIQDAALNYCQGL